MRSHKHYTKSYQHQMLHLKGNCETPHTGCSKVGKELLLRSEPRAKKMHMQLPMPRLTSTTTQSCNLSGFTPRSTLQLCRVHQENLYYLPHGGFILSVTPRAALRSLRLSLPLSSGHDTCLSALPDPTVSLTDTVCLTSFQFSCKVCLWRDVVVKLKKALACTTGS